MRTLPWQAWAIGSAVFAALTALLGKVGVQGMASDLATAIRTAIVLLLSIVVVSARGEWQRPTALPTVSLVALIASGLATGLSWLCYYRALQLGPASRVAPVDKLSVVLVILLAWAFLGEAMTWKTAVGGLLVGAGAILIAW